MFLRDKCPGKVHDSVALLEMIIDLGLGAVRVGMDKAMIGLVVDDGERGGG